uniref:Nudix hydrolase 3 n=1 Tax=Fagus sylvatica TaxID=28930 RepID=A0A2N9IF52_FAGSY
MCSMGFSTDNFMSVAQVHCLIEEAIVRSKSVARVFFYSLKGTLPTVATFEAFIGVRDDKATAQLKLFGDNLKILEQNLPLDSKYKSEDVIAAPIRVIQLLYNAGDVKGPQTVAFNLPNDERIVNDRGTSMVMLKNVSEAKFKHILQPIADVCITKEQRELVDFESFFTHTICHECCHGIGPHTIILPNGQKSTVRLELQELHSALEEAKADIVGLWALRFLICQDLLSKSLLKSMYISFLAGCFRSVRFGLQEAHGKGQALQFNWLYDKGAFILHPDETFSVDFSRVEGAVESLSREILTIQAKGDKVAANLLLQKYGTLTHPLKVALQKLENIQGGTDYGGLMIFMRSEPKTTGNLNNQKPQWRSEQPTTKNHRGAASRPVVSSLLPWRSEQRKRGRASRRGLGGYRSDQRATPWVSWWWLAVHAVGLLVVHAVGLLVLGPCFTPWRLRSLRNPGNLKKEQPRTTVVRASRRGLGGYRSDQRATPWVSWWWLVVPVEAGC